MTHLPEEIGRNVQTKSSSYDLEPMRPVPAHMAAKVMAAAELFLERGVDGAKMSDIAEVSGIPRATLYYYFDGKEAVFAYLLTLVLDQNEAAIGAVWDSPGTAAERLSRVVRAQFDLYASHPAASQALHMDLGRAARQGELVDRAARGYLQPMAKLLKEGEADGSLRQVAKPYAVAAAILGSAVIAAEQSLRAFDEESVTELHDALMSLILEGIGAKPTRRVRQ